MTKRKVRALIAMLLIVAAIVLLAWGFWPFERMQQIISLPGGGLIVP